jgi:peptidoglycan LD-endopeptidase CwlK
MMRVLREGHRGTDVQRWQEFLISEGLLVKVADGIFDNETARATRAFQSQERLTADGRVGEKTTGRARARGMRLLRRVRDDELNQALIEESKKILKKHFRDPFGTEIPFSIARADYVALIERHYHPPGGARRPWGEHPGVSLFVFVQNGTTELIEDEDAAPVETPFPASDGATGRFQLSDRSRSRLADVHPDLVRVVERAIRGSEVDFVVLEGLRSIERQKELFEQGATRTLNSRHLSGHAIDIAPFIDEAISWHWPHYHALATIIKRAAASESVPVIWGGDWPSFPDGPHWELPRDKYPA